MWLAPLGGPESFIPAKVDPIKNGPVSMVCGGASIFFSIQSVILLVIMLLHCGIDCRCEMSR